MKNVLTLRFLIFGLLAVFYGHAIIAQPQGEYIATVGENNDEKKVILLDTEDGTIIYDNFINLASLDVGTVKQVLKVNDELWISDQSKDKVYRFSMKGNYISAIGESGGLDNIRGMQIINGQVWLSNAGNNNGAPGNAVIQIDFDGEITGSFLVDGSPWSFIPYNGDHVLITFSNSGSFSSQIAEYDLAGNYLSAWNIPAEINFIQQITEMSNGNYLASSFSNSTTGYTSGVHQYDSDGNYLATIGGTSGGSARGNIELGNGNILWTNNQGVNLANTSSGTSTVIFDGSFQFLERIMFSPPPVLDPPTDLTAELSGNDVMLSWVAPAGRDLLGYSVYRDDVSITPDPVTETTFTDEEVSPGNHIYGVSAVYNNGESPKAGPVMIFIDGDLGKIQGFVRDANTNVSIQEAWITASDADNGTIAYSTPFGGHYVLQLPAGTYDITCGAEGYDKQTIMDVSIENGMVKTHDFYLQQENGEILTHTGSPDQKTFSIYPNPANSHITISANGYESIRIINKSGQILYQQNHDVEHLEINVAHFPAGIYFVKGTNSKGVFMQKLVVK